MYVSNEKRSDGFGAQYQGIIYSIVVAEIENKCFVYTPFQSIEHNYENDPHYVEKIESFINIIDNYPKNAADHLVHYYDIVYLRSIFESRLDECLASESFQNLKHIFRQNKKIPFFQNEKINIAVHIRRSNIHDCRIEGCDTPDEYYLNKMKIIRNKYRNKDLLFHIYSQGNREDFVSLYENEDIEYHINEDVCDTFAGLVFADILITSRSSFSYTAALLSDGEIYYQRFWCPPAKHWITE